MEKLLEGASVHNERRSKTSSSLHHARLVNKKKTDPGFVGAYYRKVGRNRKEERAHVSFAISATSAVDFSDFGPAPSLRAGELHTRGLVLRGSRAPVCRRWSGDSF